MTITDGFGLPESEDKKVDGATPYLKGVDFDGEGQVLEVVGMEAFIPDDPKYGVVNEYGAGGKVTKENHLIKTGVLKEGQSLRYNFNQEGTARHFDNKSVSFFFAIQNAKLEQGDKVSIKRKMGAVPTDVKWSITKL